MEGSSEFAQGVQTIMFFNDFCKIQARAQNLKTFSEAGCQVVSHFHPGHPWIKALINSFSELLWCLNKKWTITVRFSFM